MDDAKQWEDVLALDICRYDMWYRIDPWWDLWVHTLSKRKAELPQGKDSDPQSTR